MSNNPIFYVILLDTHGTNYHSQYFINMLNKIQLIKTYVKPLFIIYVFLPFTHQVMSCKTACLYKIVLSNASSSAASIIFWFKVDYCFLILSGVVVSWSSLTGLWFSPDILVSSTNRKLPPRYC